MYTPPEALPRKKKPTLDDSDARVYQVWKGKNKFLFGGRVIFGPDVNSIFLTLALILGPLILFWTFVSKPIITAFPHGWGIFLIVFSGILTLHIVLLLFLTSGTDPGIIPRNSHPPEPDDGDSSILSLDWTGSQINQGIPPTKNLTINGMVVKVKYCQTCKLYRPPRCSHCSICNNCVERFDHHCPWVGQCIGKRNYRYFFMFVSFTFLLCIYVLVCCSINISMITHKNKCGFWKAVQESPISGALMMYTFTVCWFVGGLTTFHLYLITTNQTTYENFRYQYDRKMNPYNLGFSRNCTEVFWDTIPSSRNDFRAKVEFESSFDFRSSSSSSREMKPRMDDFEGGSLGRVERCSSEPRRISNESSWEQKIDWGISPENV